MSKLTWKTIQVPLGNLKEWNKNPAQISEKDAKQLARSLDKFGYIIPFVAAAPKNGKAELPLLDGHQRKAVELSLRHTDPKTLVDVRVPNRPLTEKEKQEAVIRMRSNTGEYNPDALLNWFDGTDLLDWGMEQKELESFGFEFEDTSQDAEPQIDRAAELLKKWKVKTGDLWQIGEHRLICGDCTDAAVVARLFGDERARLTWTDPPYGVKYGDKMEEANPIAHRVRQIENDDLPPDELEKFIRSALKNAAEFSINGAAIYVACPAGTPLPALISSFAGSGFDYRWGLVWLKDQIVLSRADYHFKHENILYGWKNGAAHYFVDDRTQSSVFEYPRPKVSEEHPTMKPVELIRHMIRNSSKKGEIVYDAFGGSGSTMLACENEKRICRIVELSPAYCAVTLQRMTDAFPGIEIERVK